MIKKGKRELPIQFKLSRIPIRLNNNIPQILYYHIAIIATYLDQISYSLFILKLKKSICKKKKKIL
jgi:hypothetical protein